MRKHKASEDEVLVKLASDWIESKGVSTWPSASGDTSDPKEAHDLAVWFLDQIDSWVEFHVNRTDRNDM